MESQKAGMFDAPGLRFGFAQDEKTYLGVGLGNAPRTAAVARTASRAGKMSKRGSEPSGRR